jgi:hypothetical protein
MTSTRIGVRQRCPDQSKQLQIIRTYEDYVRFESSSIDPSHSGNGANATQKRVSELEYESKKTLEALNRKPPVRIPEMKGGEEVAGASTKGKIIYHHKLDWTEETRQKPLKKKEFKRPGYFIRYELKVDPSEDTRYNYEASQEDFQYLTELKGSPFTVKEFERLINIFEKENSDDSQKVKSLPELEHALSTLEPRRSFDEVEKIYLVLCQCDIHSIGWS